MICKINKTAIRRRYLVIDVVKKLLVLQYCLAGGFEPMVLANVHKEFAQPLPEIGVSSCVIIYWID